MTPRPAEAEPAGVLLRALAVGLIAGSAALVLRFAATEAPRLVWGGSDLVEGVTLAPRLARALVPALGACAFRGAWSGLRPATPDGLPAVGHVPGAPGLVLAAGHHRNGILLAPITARLVADLVLGKSLPPEAAALSPARFAAGA